MLAVFVGMKQCVNKDLSFKAKAKDLTPEHVKDRFWLRGAREQN